MRSRLVLEAQPAVGEPPPLDVRVHQIDRSLLAPNLNDYFSAQTLEDFKSSLAPLGDPPIFHITRESLRGGMTFRVFDIVYPGKKLLLTTYTYPDGKLEQYLVEPAD